MMYNVMMVTPDDDDDDGMAGVCGAWLLESKVSNLGMIEEAGVKPAGSELGSQRMEDGGARELARRDDDI
jgi:hypothetical protein